MNIAGKLLLPLLLIVSGCVVGEGGYQDGRVYGNTISGRHPVRTGNAAAIVRNPVIVIHGLLGAQLKDSADGDVVWGVFSAAALRSSRFHQRLMYPAAQGKTLAELTGRITADGLLERSEIQVLGMSFYISNYEILIKHLQEAGFVDETAAGENELPTQFVFVYDWRRDISENAFELDKFIAAKKRMLQQAYQSKFGISDYDVQFDIVAHSMGGLIAGYYMRYGGKTFPDDPAAEFPVTWAGSQNVDKVVMLGTPNAGYADALLEACHGLKLTSYAPVIPAAVMGSFPSLYQMMPDPDNGTVIYTDSGEKIDIWDIEIWKKYGWGLAGETEGELETFLPGISSPEERQATALDHLGKCLHRGQLFRKYMRCAAPEPPEDVKIFLIAGDALPTNHTIGVDNCGRMSVVSREAGDGKITCSSARYDLADGHGELPFVVSPIPWTGVCYLAGGHMGIMNSSVFLSNLNHIFSFFPSRAQLETLERLR